MPSLFQNSDTALVEAHLYLQQVGIEATPVNQLIVGTRFGNVPLVKHQDTIRPEDGAQSVRNHDGGLAPEQPVDPLLYLTLRLGIQSNGTAKPVNAGAFLRRFAFAADRIAEGPVSKLP
jgi:hypothetical protein